MPTLQDVHHVSLTVTDLDVSVAWYTEVLQLAERFREDSPTRKAAILGVPTTASSIGLVQHAGSPRSAFDPAVTGLDHVAFTVTTAAEMRDWARHLDSLGVVHSGPIPVPPGEILNFKDPDGIALALFWDKPADAAGASVERSPSLAS